MSLLTPRLDKDGYLRYSVHRANGTPYNAALHRIVFEAAKGPLPDGWDVHHKNLQRDDCRLENLEAVPSDQHKQGRNNPRVKLTEDQVFAILASDASTAFLAEDFNVSPSQIRRIRRGDSWRNLTGF